VPVTVTKADIIKDRKKSSLPSTTLYIFRLNPFGQKVTRPAETSASLLKDFAKT
jgi:hypothetical protein